MTQEQQFWRPAQAKERLTNAYLMSPRGGGYGILYITLA